MAIEAYRRASVLTGILISLLAVEGRAADQSDRWNDSWNNLKHITHERSYTVVSRDSQCLQGYLVSADDKAITLSTEQAGRGKTVETGRLNVLRVTDYSSALAHRMVFSARSSWGDVKAIGSVCSRCLKVLTKAGKVYESPKPVISDESIGFEGNVVATADVQSVWFVRLRPITKTDQYLEEESFAIFDPKLWFGGVFLGKIQVLLFDSGSPEDNSSVICRER